MNVRQKTKSFSKTFTKGVDVEEIDSWICQEIEAKSLTDGPIVTKHKYVITVTKIIPNDKKEIKTENGNE